MYDFVGRITRFVTKGSLLTAIVLLLSLSHVICCASEARSAVCRGPIPDIDSSTSYCFYYGKWNDCVIQDIVKRFKLVILHPGADFPKITPDQVAELRAAGVIVIGYISFGEDYICTRTENERGPVYYYDAQDCGLIYEDQGDASWYVDEVDNETGEPRHDDIPDKNPHFGSCYVNAGDPFWLKFIKSATIESQAFAGADYILNTLGCDGLFIDCIETAVPWLPYDWSWRGMFDLIDEISYLYPEKYMVANRPLFACRLDLDPYPLTCCDGDPDCINFCFCDFPSQVEARDAFRCNINAFVWESYSLDKAFDDFFEMRSDVMECADNSDGRGFNVLVLDYHNLIKGLYTCMDYQIKEVQDLNWLDYIAPGPLDHIGYWVYNYLNNFCYPLMDGYFDDWERWNVSYCRTDPCGDVPRKSADIVDIAIAHDPEYLYLMIHCGESIEFFPNFYRIFLDSGTNVSSYKGPQGKWKGSFDYLWENGRLHRYAGSGSDWMWEEIPSISSYALGAKDATRMEVSISRCSIGAYEGDGRVATKLLFNAEAFDVNSNDWAPDDPEQDYYLYEYEPLIVIDGDMEDWENMPKDCGNLCCTFSDGSVDIQDCSGDIDKLSICSDLSSIYLKMDFACNLHQSVWGDKSYQVFIDVDQSQSTGYNACEWKIGAEYLWENGSLFKHIGESSCDWLWELIPEAGTEYAVGLSDKSQIEVSIPRPSMVVPLCMRTLSQASPLRLIHRVVRSGVVLDVVPDSPDKNFLPWPACLEGDFDEDQDVDGSDLAVFASDFGRTDCNQSEACDADFDGDGYVDESDLAAFAAEFGRTDCPICP